MRWAQFSRPLTQVTEHLTGADDGDSLHSDLPEMTVSSDEEISFRIYEEFNQIVIGRVIRNDTRRVFGIFHGDSFLGQTASKSLYLIRCDVVLLSDTRMQKRFLDLVEELWTDDQFELAVLPQIEQLGGSA